MHAACQTLLELNRRDKCKHKHVHCLPLQMVVSLAGPLDEAALRFAFAHLLARHEVLRYSALPAS